ncbi:glutamine--tRNA ligase/YqeY domain fusion protein [Aureispira sp. CCB-E]|uniref:glutamine--tRNA ligase/YqeY domain fusion protein n=1 Tax=Aureispira sp. CCB-E TaxID=3051121 RepID=UPI0028696BBB|nr:glutamine--tRNA ligase/YqeY domain fusion protein [Aureispira sp. CCB-E]WMX14051.1 glutamine--tRNA ligase/YqeY domain fusion protein [Aureispira sp. CCB-E]
MSHKNNDAPKTESLNFIERIIEEHNETGKFDNRVLTRFPPEPNGYLHIGHAKAICINFGIAQKYGGKTNLRFDDTNPLTEETRFVNSIQEDIKWLGFEWEKLLFTSDYFDTLYEYALKLIKDGLAYVDFSTPKVMDDEKKKGQESKYRNSTVEENLAEFDKMKNGAYEEGTCVLRLKIDMQADNRQMRDPVIYRILKTPHHRTGDKWCIYPMYDWAHGQSDSIERITHSLCSLEFENHRPLYNWCQEKLEIYRSQQIEFSRLNLDYTVTSKRKLKELIELGLVQDWDDPRMPTLSGMRRRGYTPAAIRDFIDRAGVSKRDQYLALSSLEGSVRDDLNKHAPRVMGVLNPLKVVITNYPEGTTENLEVDYHQKDESMGSRTIPFSREVYIEKEDFAIEANRKWRRLAPGKDVRLKGAYIVHCTDFKTDENGAVVEVHCTYYENSRSGQDTSGIKAGVIHWVSIEHAVPAQVHLYDRLFSDQNPTGHKKKGVNEKGEEIEVSIDFKTFLNPNSLKTVSAYLEPSLVNAQPSDSFQFMRLGYFCVDKDSTKDNLIFNRSVTLKDSWAKQKK